MDPQKLDRTAAGSSPTIVDSTSGTITGGAVAHPSAANDARTAPLATDDRASVAPPDRGDDTPVSTAHHEPADPRLLAWSYSRHRQLRECERKDFYRRIALPLLGRTLQGAQRAALERLKHLTELPMVGGRILHDVASELVLAIRDGRPEPTRHQLVTFASARYEAVLRDADRPEAWYEAPHRVTGLRDVIQHGRVRAVEVKHIAERVLEGAATADQLPVLADLRQCSREDIRVFADPVGFELDGSTPMWAAPDVLYRHHDPSSCQDLIATPTWCIVDFKTGQPDPDAERLQLATYALFVAQQLRLPMTDGAYLGRVVRLGTEIDTWMRLTLQDMDDVRAIVRQDRALIERRLERMPRDAGLRAAASAFAPAVSRRTCDRCVYAKGCDGAQPVPLDGRHRSSADRGRPSHGITPSTANRVAPLADTTSSTTDEERDR